MALHVDFSVIVLEAVPARQPGLAVAVITGSRDRASELLS
jgi:hypothetical protein